MTQDEHLLSIAQVADRAGLRLSRVRYYERAGLLPPPEHAGRGRRYPAGVVERLHMITAAQEAGLSLTEIRELSELPGLTLDRAGGARA
jgi:DNA-binding transcriptional MerR regulator